MIKVVKLIILIVGTIGIGYGMVITFPGLLDGTSNGLWFILLFVIGIFWLFGWIKSPAIKRDFEEIDRLTEESALTDIVTVISKLHEKTVDGAAGIVGTTHSYFVVFEFPDKSRKKFEVNAEQFALVREDDRGLLSYAKFQGKFLLVDFQLQT